MANTSSNPSNPMARVRIRLFKDNARYSGPVYASVNDVTYQIPRGVAVDVPFCIAKLLEESQAQDERTAVLISRMSGGTGEPEGASK